MGPLATKALAAEPAGAPAGEHTSGGLPQLDFATYPSQILWLVLVVVVLYYAFSRVSLPRIAAVQAERRDTIITDLEAAKQARAEAGILEAAQEKTLEAARTQARAIGETARARIREENAAALDTARTDIALLSQESEERLRAMYAAANSQIAVIAEAAVEEILRSTLKGAGLDMAALRESARDMLNRRTSGSGAS